MEIPKLAVTVAVDTGHMERKMRIMATHLNAMADELNQADEEYLREELRDPELVHPCAVCGAPIVAADIERVVVEGCKVFCGPGCCAAGKQAE